MKYLISLSVAVLVLMSCASSETKVRTVSGHQSPATALENIQKRCQSAKDQEVNLLSPTHTRKGLEFTETARNLFQKGATLDEIYGAIGKAESEIALAFETAGLSRSQLKDTLERRAIAKEVLAQSEKKNVAGLENLQEDFEEGESSFLKLSKAIENGDSDWARNNQEDSLEIYNRIISQGSHKTSLDEVERIIQQAHHEGAKKYVPKTFTETNRRLELASKTIAKDPRNLGVVQKTTDGIQFQARRLLELTRAAKEIANREPEEMALWVETRLHSINALVAPDVRDRKFEDQVANIQRSISEMRRTGRNYEGEAKKLQSNIQGLQSELKVKGRAYALEEKMTALRGLFSDEEADVFRDGKRVTIRLKTLRFPQGQAGLSSDNFPVLERVQKSIALLGTPRLTVEGHTDSVGSDISNQRLSLERAKSVKGYLLSSGKVKSSQISIAGLGFSKPLTSNRTEQGRAINRRIDVVLETE